MLCAILFQCVIGTYLKYRKKGRVLERSLKEMSHIFFILEKDFFLEMTESKHSPITYPYD